MKSDKKILLAFLLNFLFAIIEFVGGLITFSVAIMSDSIHDLGDSLSIGVSYFLEKKSKKEPNHKFTYGYRRYSVIGSVITTLILLVGSCLVIYNAIIRIINPVEINYDGMIIFAAFGLVINFLAAYFTSGGNSLNQKAVNLHMLEDVLGWAVVLIGAIVMRFTNFSLLDPILSIIVAIFIFINAIKGLKKAVDLFLEKTPNDIDIHHLQEHLCEIEGVCDVHHVHVWSLDGHNNIATLHVVYEGDALSVKEKVREELCEHKIKHSTIELEIKGEDCSCKTCEMEDGDSGHHHHHHHHHH